MGDLLQNPDSLFQAFSRYNEAIWPVQIFAYAMAALVVFLAVKRIKYSDNIIFFILSFYWLWAGIVCLFGFLGPEFPIFYMLGALAVFQGCLFLYFGLRAEKELPAFSFSSDRYGIIAGVFIIFALILYPLIGLWTGHPLSNYPVFGVAPCPVCIFTLGILITSRKRFPLILLIVPLAESILGFIPTLLGLYADIGLIIAGVAAFILILHRRRQA